KRQRISDSRGQRAELRVYQLTCQAIYESAESPRGSRASVHCHAVDLARCACELKPKFHAAANRIGSRRLVRNSTVSSISNTNGEPHMSAATNSLRAKAKRFGAPAAAAASVLLGFGLLVGHT